MKTKNYCGVFGGILVFVLLVLCAFSQPPNQTRDQILQLIPQAWRTVHPASMDSLADQILRDNEELAKLYADHRVADIAALYVRRRGQIVKRDYVLISGRADIESFWEEFWQQNTALRFEVVSIQLSDNLGSHTKQGITFDTVAYVVLKFCASTGGGPCSPTETRVYCHQSTCPWGACIN